MSNDKTTIGLTDTNRIVMERITTDFGWFQDQMHAAKFALAVAVNNGVEYEGSVGTGTVWNVGSFDPDNELRDLMLVLYSDTKTPYRLIEYLYNRGLEIIGVILEQYPNINIAELMQFATDSSPANVPD